MMLQPVFGLGTRDEAQKMHPAFAPGLNSSPEVGPGRYNAPSSLGKQASSDHAFPGAVVFTTADRFAVSTRSITYVLSSCSFHSTCFLTPGCVCVCVWSCVWLRPIVIVTDSRARVWCTALRLVAARVRSPGPVYTPKLDFKSTAYKVPSIKFGTSERKPALVSKTPAPKYNTAVEAGRLATVSANSHQTTRS
jgi:hypothetical protein